MDLPFSIQRKLVWLAGFIAIGSGGFLALDGSQQIARLGFTLGSVVVMAFVVGVWLLSRSPSGARIPDAYAVSAIAGLLFMACGLTWMIPAQFPTQSELQLKNATIVLLAGGALFTLSHLGWLKVQRVLFFPHAWLSATLVAAVVAWLAVHLHDRSSISGLDQDSLFWGLSGLLAGLGLAILLATVVNQLITLPAHGRSNRAEIQAIGLCLAGSGFVLHAVFLLREPRTDVTWWLPVLSVGILLVTSQQTAVPEVFPVAEARSSQKQLRGPVLVLLTIVACIATAVIAALLQDEASGSDWALIATAGLVLIVATLSVCVSAMRFQTWIGDLGNRVSLLSRLSQTDPLTGIANRRALDERLAAEIQRAARFEHPLTIGLIDIDDFKLINDTYGHAAGDLMLRRLASLLVRELRTIDVVGRFGGEEFLIVLPETDATGAVTAATRILNSVRAGHHGYLGAGWHITVSIGLAEFAIDGRSVSELIEVADRSLYEAKREGKNRLVMSSKASYSGLQ
jgi:diguanylate cyclase (GGDEF)-like protein